MKIEYIPLGLKFFDVFPEKLCSLPPQRQIDFEIELVLDAKPISTASCNMTPTDLKPLKT